MNSFLQIILQIVSYDLWFYVSHIILHFKIPYLYIHLKHHEKNYKQLYFLDVYEANIFESIIQSLGIFFPYFICNISLNNLLIACFITNLRGLMRDDNRFSWLIGNHHLLHHKNNKYNYGEYWIDNIFGTLYPYKEDYIYGKIYT
jgi:hypothetical protein